MKWTDNITKYNHHYLLSLTMLGDEKTAAQRIEKLLLHSTCFNKASPTTMAFHKKKKKWQTKKPEKSKHKSIKISASGFILFFGELLLLLLKAFRPIIVMFIFGNQIASILLSKCDIQTYFILSMRHFFFLHIFNFIYCFAAEYNSFPFPYNHPLLLFTYWLLFLSSFFKVYVLHNIVEWFRVMF